MIAKIIKGTNFSGVVSYMLSKEKGKAKVLASNNIGFIDQNLCADEFALQASMRPNVQKPVCHTILSFSASDAERLTDDVMVKIANEYLEKAIIYDITLFLAITSILSYILLISISLLFLSAISKET